MFQHGGRKQRRDVFSPSLLLNHLKPQSSKALRLLPIIQMGILAYFFTLLWDFCRNSCTTNTKVHVSPHFQTLILVPRAHDPSGLRQESRALWAIISGMRHRCRLRETGWAEFGYFLCYRYQSFRFSTAGQGERRPSERDCQTLRREFIIRCAAECF